MFDEVQFPKEIVAFGSRSGPGHETKITETDSGLEERVGRWPHPRHQFRINLIDRSNDQITEIRTFAIARQGALRGFRVKDNNDYTTNANGTGAPTNADVLLGIGDGVNKVFQLQKKYTSGLSTVNRKINKPVIGTALGAVDGVSTVEGTDWSLDSTTGRIFYAVAPPAADPVTGGCEFDVPVRFDDDVDAWLGTVRSEPDENSVTALGMREIFDPVPVPGVRPYSGGIEKVINANIVMSLLEAHSYVIDAQQVSLKVATPAPDGLPTGGELFSVINDGANTFTVVDHLDAVLATLTTDTGVDIHLMDDGVGGFFWYAF